MLIDIVTLKLVLCIINILNLFILYIQYLSNKSYKGILYWITGFGFIAISQIITLKFIFPSNEFISLFSDLFILIGFSIVSIGISKFVTTNFTSKNFVIIILSALVIIIFTFFTQNLVVEKFLLSFFKSIICYHIVKTLLYCKLPSIQRTTNFIGILFCIYASVFLAQSVSILVNGISTNLDSPIFIVIYLFSIIVGIISTFGFTFLVNQRLIGEREKAERNAQLIQYAVNNTSDAVYWVKKDGSFLELNNAACSILGYTHQELMQLKVPDIDPDYNQEIWPKHWEELKQKKSMTFNSSHRRKDGLIVPTEVNANYIFYNGDEINCAFVRDITERKKGEEKVNNLIEETISKNTRLQNFAHIVSHNIRSHSANFSGLLEIIRTAETEEEKKTYFEYLNSSSIKLSETIDNLNEIITIQTNTQLPIEKVNLFDEIQKNIQSQMLNIEKLGIQIENNIKSDTFLNVVPAYFDSIVLNLITNAIKYKSDNKTPIIKINSLSDEKYTQLSIEDNGIGINLEKNGGKLFGMYNTFNGNSDAKGIGLFITKNQIEAMKGKIEVTSQLGIGTTFKVFFLNNF